MTSRFADMTIADNQDRRSSVTGRHAEVSYVLVADADVQRTAVCVDTIKPFNVGVLVARDGEEALGIVHRFGPPVLLITDLSLPRKDGFAVIEAVRDIDGGRTEIIAWSAVRELREFAAHRLAGLNVRILSGTVAPAVLRGAIERALRAGTTGAGAPAASPAALADETHRAITELADRARAVAHTAGAAVYLKAAGQARFRAAVTWTSDVPIPDAPQLPRVFEMVVESGAPVVLRDVSAQPLPGMARAAHADGVRGIAAVPIVSGSETVGAICVFDVRPLDLTDSDIDALKVLGGAAVVRPHYELPRFDTADEPPPASAVVEDDARPKPRATSGGASTGTSSASLPPSHEATADRRSLGGGGQASDVDRNVASVQKGEVDAVSFSLLDRRGGDQAIARELARVRREQRQLSVILFDVEAANRREEDFAEPLADALGEASETLTRAIRGSDLAIQWSRDELLVVLPGLNGSEARQVAERVRAAIQAGARHRVAVAGGVAELLANESVESAVARANEKVRLARERGHNRVG
jgi:diguanylate cyclase (GGDEF)-like protein